MTHASLPVSVAIACGGTGGHLYPGLAVAEECQRRGCAVTLLVSPKAVDQRAVEGLQDVAVVTLPGAGWQSGSRLACCLGFVRSYRLVRRLMAGQLPAGAVREDGRAGDGTDASAAQPVGRPGPLLTRPSAVLGMGGFTSGPPLLAARRCGVATFLHESNAIPGRTNRWLARLVDGCFTGFKSAAARLPVQTVRVTGTPVRRRFALAPAATARAALGLEPDRPVVLVVGGSQGAVGLNRAVMAALPEFARLEPAAQWIHLTGEHEFDKVRSAYAAAGLKALVLPFCDTMEVPLAAASVAISRAGASFLAELAAMRLPAVLVPFPAAADDHQWHNARQFELSGAATLLEQRDATPPILVARVREWLNDPARRARARAALAGWHCPRAAADIVETLLQKAAVGQPGRSPELHCAGPAQTGYSPGVA